MALKSVAKRIKITKTGKLLRRAMVLGHSRSNKTSVQMGRKKRMREVKIHSKYFNRVIH